MNHGLDSDRQIFFYEQEFYVLSNFSSFCIDWRGRLFHTSEAVYHFEKFEGRPDIQNLIADAKSAHEALKIARRNEVIALPEWNIIRTRVMLDILLAKVNQHEYVHRKLLETGNRELVENSWRDSFWGVGEYGNGQNMLGKLWMKVRASLRSGAPCST
jgi:ribA/ribD-fused uncharacterized protein